MSWLIYASSACVIFFLACIAVSMWIRISRRMAIVDRPTARSSHTRVTPRGGGVGIVLATLTGVVVPLYLERSSDLVAVGWAGGLALTVAAVSLMDDVRSLPSFGRLVFHLVAATIAVNALGAFPSAVVPGWALLIPPQWWMPPLTVLWIVGLTNVYNFMDGIDGIAGGQGVVAGLAWTWFGVQIAAPTVTWCGVALSAACAGFLVYNWAPAKVFMGDVGSAFLGFAFAVIPLLGLREMPDAVGEVDTLRGAVPVFALLIVWPFVADGLFTFLRRIRHRQNVLDAHRSHLYQRLTIAGWGHAAVTRLYLAWAAVSALFGAGYTLGGPATRGLCLLLAVASLIAVYFVVKVAERAALSPHEVL